MHKIVANRLDTTRADGEEEQQDTQSSSIKSDDADKIHNLFKEPDPARFIQSVSEADGDGTLLRT